MLMRQPAPPLLMLTLVADATMPLLCHMLIFRHAAAIAAAIFAIFFICRHSLLRC